MKNDVIAIAVVSALLMLYCAFAMLNVLIDWVFLIVGVSPLLIIWMVWVVIRHGEYHGPELDAEQEFGYLDK